MMENAREIAWASSSITQHQRGYVCWPRCAWCSSWSSSSSEELVPKPSFSCDPESFSDPSSVRKFNMRDPEGSNRTPRHTFFTRALLNAIVTVLFGPPRDLETITADLETMTANSETMIRKLRHVIWKLCVGNHELETMTGKLLQVIRQLKRAIRMSSPEWSTRWNPETS